MPPAQLAQDAFVHFAPRPQGRRGCPAGLCHVFIGLDVGFQQNFRRIRMFEIGPNVFEEIFDCVVVEPVFSLTRVQ